MVGNGGDNYFTHLQTTETRQYLCSQLWIGGGVRGMAREKVMLVMELRNCGAGRDLRAGHGLRLCGLLAAVIHRLREI